jgi:transcriptional regulator with XRE-family HTH domain
MIRQQEPVNLDQHIASRIKARRLALAYTIEELAERSGVSRAMISKLERNEVSPTASLLAKLASALSLTLSSLFNEVSEQGPLVRASTRPVWQDPATGYLRRNVTPDISPMDIVDVTLPPGARVTYDNAVPLKLDQLVWVLEGKLTMELANNHYQLEKGDCLHMRLDRPITYHNTSSANTRYAVVLSRGLQ